MAGKRWIITRWYFKLEVVRTFLFFPPVCVLTEQHSMEEWSIIDYIVNM